MLSNEEQYALAEIFKMYLEIFEDMGVDLNGNKEAFLEIYKYVYGGKKRLF